MAESPAGSGIYGATVTHDEAFSGAIVWDLGTTPNRWAPEEINPHPEGTSSGNGGSWAGLASPCAVSADAFCTDEDIALEAQNDFHHLAPRSQDLAYGLDGVFAAGARWTMTSEGSDFEEQGVNPGDVVALTRPANVFQGAGGVLFAVDSVSGGTLVLRRLGRASGLGRPAAPAAGLTAVEFRVFSFGPQVGKESQEVRRTWDLDRTDTRTVGRLMEGGEELRRVAVLRVLRWAYTNSETLKDTDSGEAEAHQLAAGGADVAAPTAVGRGRGRGPPVEPVQHDPGVLTDGHARPRRLQRGPLLGPDP